MQRELQALTSFQANGDYGIVSWREGLRPRVLENTEGDSMDGGQGLLVVGGGGAAHSNTRGEGGRVEGNSLLDCRERVQRGKGGQKRDRRDRRRNLGLPSVAPSLL